jgi:hypothetical protein
MFDVVEAGSLQAVNKAIGSGEIRHALRQIPICGTIRQESANERHDSSEVQPIAEAQEWIRRCADIEQRNTPAVTNDSGKFKKETIEVNQIAQRETASNAIDRSIWKREYEDVGLGTRCATAVLCQHAEGEVHGDRSKTRSGKIDAKVSRSTRQVEHE